MKIERVVIDKFKAIDHFEWDLRDAHGEPRRRALLVGENGSGKTSVLQAITFTLRSAMGAGFAWPGFYPERVAKGVCELHVRFDDAELDPHESARAVMLRLERGQVTSNPNASRTLWRRTFASADPSRGASLRDLPGLLALHQLRSAAWPGSDFESGVQTLRASLKSWDAFHKSLLLGQRELGPDDRDLLAELEVLYNRAFPGTKFTGVRPRSAGSNTEYFEIKRDGHEYDLAEASAGEQAILPLLYELVQQDLKRGVVLIDEIELHLHPPLAQALYNLLPVIAPDLQFLMTTHSQAVVDVVPEEEITRIGGRSCL